MNTFLLIVKIIPFILAIGGGVFGYFSRQKAKKLKDTIDVKNKTINTLKNVVLSQGEELEKKSKQIADLMEINTKYENKKKTVKDSKSATDSMARKR